MVSKTGPLLADASLLSSHIPDIDHHWILHFCRRTAPSLTGSADTIFWAQVLPQLSFAEPAIRHAILAVGSSHARLEAGVAPEKSQAVLSHDFSIQHYSKAVAALRHHIFHGPGDAVTSLICCLLFVCFECLYGNRLLVLEHLRNGANILNSARFQDSDLHYVKQKLQEITLRIDQQAILVGRPISEGKQPLVIIPNPTSPFPDLEEAKEYMDLITGSCLTFIRSLFENTFKDDEQECSANAFKSHLQHQLSLWKDRMDLLVQRYPSSWIAEDPAAYLLRIRYHGCYIYLGACLSPHETSFDHYEPDFASILGLASLLSDAQTNRTPLASTPYQPRETPPSFVFSLDAGLIPAIFFTAIKSRSPVLRRKAIDFLTDYPGREAMWETKVHARVARRVVEIEESSFRPPFSFDFVLDHRVHRRDLERPSPPTGREEGGARYGIEEGNRIRHISIMDTMNEPAQTVKVVFGFAPGREGEAWCTWEEELSY